MQFCFNLIIHKFAFRFIGLIHTISTFLVSEKFNFFVSLHFLISVQLFSYSFDTVCKTFSTVEKMDAFSSQNQTFFNKKRAMIFW